MTFQVRILSRAENDVRRIYDWILERSPQGAVSWLVAFESGADSLRVNPHQWPTAPENSLVSYEVRHFLFRTSHGKKYRGIFTVVDHEVRILHVRGFGQDLLSELDDAPGD
jgi:plasmid stabilization system protein ParE